MCYQRAGVTENYRREENWNLDFMEKPSLNPLKTFQRANFWKKIRTKVLNAGRFWGDRGTEYARDVKKEGQLLNICENCSMVHSSEQLWPQPRLFLRNTILLLFKQSISLEPSRIPLLQTWLYKTTPAPVKGFHVEWAVMKTTDIQKRRKK